VTKVVERRLCPNKKLPADEGTRVGGTRNKHAQSACGAMSRRSSQKSGPTKIGYPSMQNIRHGEVGRALSTAARRAGVVRFGAGANARYLETAIF
jgi:hypothetical protein